MIVVDTNVIFYYSVPGPWSARADDLRKREPIWLAPPLWESEFRNVLVGEMRRGAIYVEFAKEIYARAHALINRRSVEADGVLELAAGSGCTAYDLEFVALARACGVPLYTMDAKLLREFPAIARPLPEVTPPSPRG